MGRKQKGERMGAVEWKRVEVRLNPLLFRALGERARELGDDQAGVMRSILSGALAPEIAAIKDAVKNKPENPRVRTV